MQFRLSALLAVSVVTGAALASPVVRGPASSPTVRLDNGTFVGTSDGTVNSFLGIPFAKPPYVLLNSLYEPYF